MSGPVGLGTRVLGALKWLTLAKTISQSTSWLVTLVVIRLLEPSDYGLMAIVSATTGMMLAFGGTVGLADALQRSKSTAPEALRQIFTINLCVSCLLAVALAAGAYPLAELFGDRRLVALLQVAALAFVVSSISMIPRVLVFRELDHRTSMKVEVVGGLSSSTVVLVCAYSGLGVWSLLLAYLTGQVVGAIGYQLARPFVQWPLFRLGVEARGMVSFGALRTVEQFLWTAYTNADAFIVGKILGAVPLGFYNVARTIASLPVGKLAIVLNPITFATFAILQDDRAQAAVYFRKGLRVLTLLAFPIFFGLSAVAPLAVPVVLGEKWVELVVPIQVLSFSSAFALMGVIINPFLQGVGQIGGSLKNTIVGLVLQPPAIAIGCFWGVTGAVAALALVRPVIFFVSLYRAARLARLDFGAILVDMIRPAIAAFAMFAAVLAATPYLLTLTTRPVALGAAVAGGAVVYAVLVLLVDRPAALEFLSLVRDQRGRKKLR